MTRAVWRAIEPAVLGLAGAIALSSATGFTLNLFLGAAAYAAVMSPLVAQYAPQSRWRSAGLFNLMVAIVWLAAVIDHQISISQWLSMTAVLAAVAACELAVGERLEAVGLGAAVANAVVLLAAVVWATWPVWGSLHLPETGAAHVVAMHPLFALNGVVPDLGIWSEQHVPYQLTAFGQNVVYRLPATVIPCIALHGGLAGVCVAIGVIGSRKRSVPRARLDH